MAIGNTSLMLLSININIKNISNKYIQYVDNVCIISVYVQEVYNNC